MNDLRILILSGSLLLALISAGQTYRASPVQGSARIQKATVIQENEPVTIGQQRPFTAVAIRTSTEVDQLIVSISGRTYRVPRDPDSPPYTYFLSLGQPAIELIIETAIPGTYEVFTISSGEAPAGKGNKRSTETDDCSFGFDFVPQETWRAGLPEPSYSRSFTTADHVVVHHAAGSNTNTNYTQVVRDIYLLHTEINGWSDIGYNYLVAQDGTIFAGRDPASGTQDEVLGAHFCGANGGTMGICVLGNYETAVPTVPSLSSLEQLIAFKLNKESLSPFEVNAHSLGSFEAVIGHRQGCSTACPGDHLFNLLPEIKSQVQFILDSCLSEPPIASNLNFSSDRWFIEAGESITYTNQSETYEHYVWILEGGDPEVAYWQEQGSATYPLPGIFDVTLIGIAGGLADTLVRKDLVEVKVTRPLVFPNPVHQGDQLTVLFTKEITSVGVITVLGQMQELYPVGQDSYQFPFLQPGFYLLRISSDSRTFHSKLLVR